MNKIVSMMVAVAVMVAGVSAYAGDGCGGCKGKAARKGGDHEMFSKLNLTDEQKTKLTALKAECKEAGCSEEAHAKFAEGAKTILTPEQLAQWKAACEKGSCTRESAAKK